MTELRRLRVIEHLEIPMADGVRIAGKLWLPEDAAARPVPAILEMIPYRKRDGTVFRDVRIHPWIAARGYACLRIDLRGSGESEGVLVDEYLAQEQQDGLALIDWAARQPWCSGAVGMTGISWGGFNALQLAALRPPALKAIVTLCSTDDRYADDIHWMGGCLINENPAWSADRFTWGALPPDPQLVGERWRAMWLERLEAHRPWLETWLGHQRRDAYWRHGSVCEDLSAIQCAVYAIGGWDDSYSNAVPRLLAGLACPRKGLVGPWSHAFPHLGTPGPAIGYLQEAVRWWDHWLKGIDTGMMGEPMYRAWMLEPKPPRPWVAEHPGRWVAEPCWPSPGIRPAVLHLAPGRLSEAAPAEAAALAFRSPQITGGDCGRWGGYGGEDPDLPLDQRAEDGRSLCFDTVPLPEDVEILGAPVLEAVIASDRPAANLAVRLCDVAPDGVSALVTYGLLNLTHRDGHEHPAPLEPGRPCRIRVQLNDIARRFARGSRIRLALATAHWPIAWPAPEDATLTIDTAASRLVLPVRPPRGEDALLAPFEPAVAPPPLAWRETRPARGWRLISDDAATGRRTISIGKDYGAGEIVESGIRSDAVLVETYEIAADDPLSARARIEGSAGYGSGPAEIRIATVTELSADRETFRLDARIAVRERGRTILERRFEASIGRDFM